MTQSSENAKDGASDLETSDTHDISAFPPAAQRALKEAQERQQKSDRTELPPELGGRDGPEPVRYGDWEKKGLAVDF